MGYARYPPDQIFELYCFRLNVDGRSYIGCTGKGWERRAAQWTGSNHYPLNRAIAEYGREAFSVEHIASARGPENAKLTERQLIEQHRTLAPRGFNQNTGGTGRPLGWRKYPIPEVI